MQPSAAASASPGPFSFDDGTANNRVGLFAALTGGAEAVRVDVGGVSTISGNLTTANLAAGYSQRGILGFDGTTYYAQANGTTLSAAGAAMSGLTLAYGNTRGGINLNGYLQSVAMYPRLLSATERNAYTFGTDLTSLNLNFASGSYSAVINGQRFQTTSLTSLATAMGATFTFTNSTGGYVPWSSGTLTLVPANTPRISDLGLLVEQASTNFILQSQTFDNASWAKGAATVVPDAITAPDGTLTADKLVEDNAISFHRVLPANVTYSAGSWTFSLYAKAAERSAFQITLPSAPFLGTDWADYDLTNCTLGTTGAGATASAAKAANGWCKLTLTGTSSGAVSQANFAIANSPSMARAATYQGDGVSGVYVWQGQVENLGFATSPILTTSASATRSADLAFFTGLTYAGGPLTLGSYASGSNTAGYFTELSDGTSRNRLIQQLNGAVANVSSASVTGGATSSATVGVGLSSPIGAALMSQASSARASANGGAVVSVGTGAVPAGTLSRLQIGSNFAGGSLLNGFVRQTVIYPYAASDGELQSRSAGNW